MASHRFQVGDRVRIVRPSGRNVVEAFPVEHAPVVDITPWSIERLGLADEMGSRYFVRSEFGVSRVVHEDEIEKR